MSDNEPQEQGQKPKQQTLTQRPPTYLCTYFILAIIHLSAFVNLSYVEKFRYLCALLNEIKKIYRDMTVTDPVKYLEIKDGELGTFLQTTMFQYLSVILKHPFQKAEIDPERKNLHEEEEKLGNIKILISKTTDEYVERFLSMIKTLIYFRFKKGRLKDN